MSPTPQLSSAIQLGFHAVGALLLASIGISGAAAVGEPHPMAILEASVVEVSAAQAVPAVQADKRPMLVRTTLSDAELSATMQFEVALKMRNLAELQARVARGEIISQPEMEERYFPLATDYAAEAAWLQGLGFTITGRYDNHLAFFVRAPVSRIRDALDVSFARVAYLGKEYTSAISAPSVPADLAPALVGINGLQPHLRMRAHHTPLRPYNIGSNYAPYVPANLAVAYNATGLGVNGSGQTIGLIGYAFPSGSDISQFWQECGIPQSPGAVTDVTVGAGPPSSPAAEDLEEITLDTEWCSSVAPGASVRIYGTSDSDEYGDQAMLRIISDLSSQPQMHQLSVSYGSNEDQYSSSQMKTDAQYLATIAGKGVSVFFASGDGGSRPDPNSGLYGSNDPPQVGYPASDLSVTGVGGTTLVAQNYSGTNPGYTESAWFSDSGGSGGGVSQQFGRPAWQVGEGVPSGSQRLVPDVAAAADPNDGAYLVYNGTAYAVGGTSWSSPTWAGYCALFNQARIAAGLGPIGLLNPRIYPLEGSSCFQDIVTGNNGDYFAGPGYDECTGLGTPNIGVLVKALSLASPQSIAPTIASQPAAQTIQGGESANFTVVVNSYSSTTYQWQVLAPNSSAWTNVADNSSFSGATTASLDITDVTTGMAGDQFQCVVTNAAGSITSASAALTVPAVQPPLLAPSGSLDELPEGSSLTLGTYYANFGSIPGPFTFQWYHDGRAISGATSSTFSISSVGFSDAGEYVLAVGNPGGNAVLEQTTVIVENPPAGNGWLDAQQQGSVVYFLYASPAEVLRYDMNAGEWLSPVALSGTPTAFRVATEGVYIAFGRTTSLYSPDLSTVTPLVNTEYPTTLIFVNGNYAILMGSSDNRGVFTTIERNGGASVATSTGAYYESTFAQGDVSPELGILYGESDSGEPSTMVSFNLNSDGTVTAASNPYAYLYTYPGGSRVYALPGGLLVANNGGAVFNGTSLALVASFGAGFDDLCFLPDGSPVAVRGNEVTLYGSGTYVESGRVALSAGAPRIFANGSTVTGFTPPAAAGGPIGVETVTEAQLAASPRTSAPAVDPSSVNFMPDDGFVGADGQLYLLSRLNRSLFVWSPTGRNYVKSIPLQGVPTFISYSNSLNRVYLAYDDNRLTRIDLGVSDAEVPFANMPTHLIDFAAADGQVYVHEQDGQDSGEMQNVFDANGNLFLLSGFGYYADQVYWDSATQSIYQTSEFTFGAIQKLPVLAFGTPVSSASNIGDEALNLLPLRFSGDGSLLVDGQGVIYGTATLNQAGVLGSTLVDAAWLGTAVFTLNASGSGSVVQFWGGQNYLLSNSSNLAGYPLRLWPLPGNELVAVTAVNGTAAMSLVNSLGFAPSPYAPQISVQPQSQTSNTGSTVVFASGAPGSVQYQWQFDGVNLVDGTGVSGSTGPQLVLSGVTSASAGNYTCVISNASGESVTSQANLTVTDSSNPGFLVNISSRAFVGTGGNILIGGFYIGGSTSRSVLIQALGPALAGEGVTGVLQHPALTIHDSTGATIYSDTGWGNSKVLLAAAASAYAAPVLNPDSGDSEVLLTLPPGGYTAQVAGADGGTGVALVAIYQLP